MGTDMCRNVQPTSSGFMGRCWQLSTKLHMLVAFYETARVCSCLPNCTCRQPSTKLHVLVAVYQTARVGNCLPNCTCRQLFAKLHVSVAVYQAAHVGGFLPNCTCQWLSAKLHILVAAHKAAHIHSCLPNCMFHDPEYITSAHIIWDIRNFRTPIGCYQIPVTYVTVCVSLQYL